MANETTSTSANDYVYAARILAQNILPNFYGHNNAAHLTRFSSIAGFPSNQENFPIAGALAAQSLQEGSDADYTQYSTSVASISVSEVGLVLALTDVLTKADIVAGMEHYASQMGQALANKVTVDILNLSSGFSSQVGTTTVDLSEANILDGIQTLAAAGVPGPYHGQLHPIQWRDLAAAVGGTLTPAGTTGSESVAQVTNAFGAEPAFSGGLNQLYGVNWAVSSNVPTATAGADRLGMIVSPMYAIGYVEKWPARVEMERDASLRATEVAVTSAYGVGELLDAAGVGVLTDA